MFKSRMLDNVKLSRYIPPIWLAILISIGFIHVGEIFAGIIIGTVLAMVNPIDDRATLMEVFGHYYIFFQIFNVLINNHQIPGSACWDLFKHRIINYTLDKS